MRSVRLSLAAVLLVALLGFDARAQTTGNAEAFRQTWNQGIDAFNLGQYPEAWIHFERAAKLAPDKPGPFRYLGRTARALERWQECIDNATLAIRFNPESKYAPDVMEDIRICREALGRPMMNGDIPEGQGAVAVISNVEGASVELDGIKKGATPLSPFPATAGRHDVHVERRGYLPLDLVITVVPGVVVDVEATLEADPAYSPEAAPTMPSADDVKHGWLVVQVDRELEGVTYVLGGKRVQPAADGAFVAEPGIHELIVTAPDHVPWRRRVVVVRGQRRGFHVGLKPQVDRRRERLWAITSLGFAAAAGATGAVFGALENDRYETARDWAAIERDRPGNAQLPEGLPESVVRSREEIREVADEADRYGLVSNISFGVAAVALGVGVYFLVQERTEDRRGYELPMALVPTLTADGGVGASLVYTRELGL